VFALCANTFITANSQPFLRKLSSEIKTSSSADHGNNLKFTYQITNVLNETFGYDIYADGCMMIHQTCIPCVPGNEGFKVKEDAIKVAQLVINKIKKGKMPPSVTVDEIKKLKVIK